jgi:putative PIN family toxin of toxin-antitoxin system
LKSPRAVFDVTVLLDALLRPEAASAALLRRLVTERDFELVLSPAILQELERTLATAELAPFLASSSEDLSRWVASLGVVAMTVAGDVEVAPGAHSPEDAIYLAAATESAASLVVTLDPELLRLAGEAGPDVVEPEVLLELLQARRLGASG